MERGTSLVQKRGGSVGVKRDLLNRTNIERVEGRGGF